MRILLTNDDGLDSPLFFNAIEQLTNYGDLTIAVRAQEQSWKGKSMTRVGRVEVQQTEVRGHAAYAISGTPADCVNIAIYNLMPEPPDLVVSGINVGLNTGVSLVLASGTVGACLEGNIAGIPGIALSQQLSRETYEVWDAERRFDTDTLARLGDNVAKVMPLIWAQFVEQPRPSTRPIPATWNINFPFELKNPQPVYSYLGHNFYKKVFRGDLDSGFIHRMEPFERDSHPQADYQILSEGRVSATLLDITTFGAL